MRDTYTHRQYNRVKFSFVGFAMDLARATFFSIDFLLLSTHFRLLLIAKWASLLNVFLFISVYVCMCSPYLFCKVFGVCIVVSCIIFHSSFTNHKDPSMVTYVDNEQCTITAISTKKWGISARMLYSNATRLNESDEWEWQARRQWLNQLSYRSGRSFYTNSKTEMLDINLGSLYFIFIWYCK